MLQLLLVNWQIDSENYNGIGPIVQKYQIAMHKYVGYEENITSLGTDEWYYCAGSWTIMDTTLHASLKI